MGQTLEIGTRIELVPMDPHFQDISLALYQQAHDRGPVFLVHTYSRKDGAGQRIDFVGKAMQVLGGMEVTPEGLLHFPCWSGHVLAVKRLFLEACKQNPNDDVVARPGKILDRKSGLQIPVLSQGEGRYRVTAEGEAKGVDRRIRIFRGGLAKLGEMEVVEETDDEVVFGCGVPHDALVGLLLVRAPNVRAVIREEEQAASRGMLSAPSAQ
ncbi:MAG: hypothetical protein O7G87_09520 [bacterium]|nr:hypothetical protein [bacterium]